jgi:microcystin-dependent protein
MADPFVGEIRLFGFPRIPVGWAACDGSVLSIAENDVLFLLIGTTFGGDGISTFNVPDLRGRVPLSQGNGPGLSPRVLGELGGQEAHTLLLGEMAQHGHGITASTTPGTITTPAPSAQFAAASLTTSTLYAPQAAGLKYEVMAASITATGNNLPHDNMMPTLTCNYCICTSGIFPSQT